MVGTDCTTAQSNLQDFANRRWFSYFMCFHYFGNIRNFLSKIHTIFSRWNCEFWASGSSSDSVESLDDDAVLSELLQVVNHQFETLLWKMSKENKFFVWRGKSRGCMIWFWLLSDGVSLILVINPPPPHTKKNYRYFCKKSLIF